MKSSVWNHIPAWESPYTTIVWVPFGSPNMHAGMLDCPTLGQHDDGGPPHDALTAVRAGVRSAGTSRIVAASRTTCSTWTVDEATDVNEPLVPDWVAVGVGTAWKSISTVATINASAIRIAPRPMG